MSDVNVTKKAAWRVFEDQERHRGVGGQVVRSVEPIHYRVARAALSALADPEVLAGIAEVLESHAINGRRTWQWVYCACGWVAKGETTADGYREHREHVAAAVVGRLMA